MQTSKQLLICIVLLLVSFTSGAKKHPKTTSTRSPTCLTTNLKEGNIAVKAAAEAKQAVASQQRAGEEAAHQVKQQLAEKAAQASNAAQAAFAGKQEMVDHLHKEIQQMEIVAQQEGSSLQQLQSVRRLADKAVQEVEAEGKLLKTSLQMAEEHKVHAVQAEEGMQKQLSEKEELLDAAASRLETLRSQLRVAKKDLQTTKEATRKAEAAAAEAKENALRNRRKIFRKDEVQDSLHGAV